MIQGPYREVPAHLRLSLEATEPTGRLEAVASSAVGWASATLTARLLLSAARPQDAAWGLAAAAFGACLAHGASRSRPAAAVSIVGGTLGGAVLGSVVLSSALASKGLPVAAGFRFALANGGALGVASGFLLGALWAPAARATRETERAFAAGRSDAATLALTWLGFVGVAGAAAAWATGVAAALPGAVLALWAATAGSLGLLVRDSKRLERSDGDRRARERRLDGIALRAVTGAALFVAALTAFLGRSPAQRERGIDAALEAIESQRAHVGHMVAIPGGTFIMGSPRPAAPLEFTTSSTPADRWYWRIDDDEIPAHTVAVHSFELDDTEVTVAKYRQCVDAEACSADGVGNRGPYLKYCNWDDESRANHPINCVSWYQADAYCRWAGKRLPTEAEWEYAARGGSGQRGHWLDTATPCSCRASDSPDHTCPAGLHPATGSGDLVLDLSGNVWEWTSSPHCNYPIPLCTDGNRIARGGGWTCSDQGENAPWRRFSDSPLRRDEELGFRCAR